MNDDTTISPLHQPGLILDPLTEIAREGARQMLAAAIDVLNERERDILVERRLRDDPVTLEDLSVRYGVSRERIRQIEVRAFEKLQDRMRKLARERGMTPAEE